MKHLSEYILEKFKIHKDIKVTNEIEEATLKWIDLMKEEDFDYCIEIIDYFLENNEFNEYDKDEVKEILKYENDKDYISSVTNIFKKFRDDVEKQAKMFR